MKVICIWVDLNDHLRKLTWEKEYEIEFDLDKHYQIRDDSGKLIWVFKKDFNVSTNS